MGGGSRGYGGGGAPPSDSSWHGLGRPELSKWYISLSFLVVFFFLHVLFISPLPFATICDCLVWLVGSGLAFPFRTLPY